jgi:hypothetical protein
MVFTIIWLSVAGLNAGNHKPGIASLEVQIIKHRKNITETKLAVCTYTECPTPNSATSNNSLILTDTKNVANKMYTVSSGVFIK